MKNKRNKRGMTVQSMLIGIIVIILGAAILFFFIKSLPYKETVDKEACRQSVVWRNNAILGGTELTPEMFPLKCKTQEITISSTNEEFIKREIANAMYDCWWMYGEGKMDFFSKTSWWDITNPFGIERVSCGICSIIKFEENVKNKKIDITDYLQNTKIPQKNITYLEYFSDQTGTKLTSRQKIEQIDTNKDYVILIMGVRGAQIKNVLLAAGVGAASGAAILGTVGAAFEGVGAIPGAILGAIIGTLSGITVGGINVGLNAMFSSIRCESSTSGCFMLILSQADASNITKICQKIESIP